MEPFAEPPSDAPAAPTEPPGGYVAYEATNDDQPQPDRRMFALAVLCGVVGVVLLFQLMAIAVGVDGYPWTSWDPGGGVGLVTLLALSLAAGVLCALDRAAGRLLAVLFALASMMWTFADVITFDLPGFADGRFRARFYLQALSQVVTPLVVVFLASRARSKPRPPAVRRPRFDPYTLNPYDDHPAFDGALPATQAPDVAGDATIDASDRMRRPADG